MYFLSALSDGCCKCFYVEYIFWYQASDRHLAVEEHSTDCLPSNYLGNWREPGRSRESILGRYVWHVFLAVGGGGGGLVMDVLGAQVLTCSVSLDCL